MADTEEVTVLIYLLDPTPAQAATSTLPAWFVPVLGFAGVALTAFVVWLVSRLRKPVEVTDLWAENRQLRTDMNAMDEKFTQRIDDIVEGTQDVVFGFVAQSTGMERDKVTVQFTPEEIAQIAAARRRIATDLEWATAPRPRTTNKEKKK